MRPVPEVTLASATDLAAVMALRESLGWWRNEQILRALHAWEQGRIFVIKDPQDARAEQAGLQATTSVMRAGPLGIIGNVIVREELRGQGLGRRIVRAALDWLRATGGSTALLAATPDGRPLYERLGFIPLNQTINWRATSTALDHAWLAQQAAAATGTHVRLAAAAALTRLAALDTAAFGGDRHGLLARLLAPSDSSWLYLAEDATGAPCGYLLAQPKGDAGAARIGCRLGPWVATTPAVAALLLHSALAAAPWHTQRAELDSAAQPVEDDLFCALSGANTNALALLERLGGSLEADDLFMRLDWDARGVPLAPDAARRPIANHPQHLYAWLAGMVM